MDNYPTPEQQIVMNTVPQMVTPTNSSFNQSLNNNIILELINPAKTIMELEMDLKGQVFDEKGDMKSIAEPLLNDIGISRVLIIAKSLINKDNTVSNLKENQIKQIIKGSMQKTLVPELLQFKTLYGLKSSHSIQIIVDSISTRAYIFLMRAEGAGERGLIGRTNQNITFNSDGGKAPKGLPALMGWKK